MVMMSPGDAQDVEPMLNFSLQHAGPTAIRYPKAAADSVERDVAPIEIGKSEVYVWGKDGMLIAFGSLFTNCIQAAEILREEGLDIGVINARFAKPIDTNVINRAIQESGFVITIEEGTLCGGFGSAVLESANDAGLNTSHLKRLGIPDHFIEHGNRNELLIDLGLDVAGIITAAREMVAKTKMTVNE